MSDLRCYVCGKDMPDSFALVSMSKGVDRVFLVHIEDCLEQVQDDAAVVVLVDRRVPA